MNRVAVGRLPNMDTHESPTPSATFADLGQRRASAAPGRRRAKAMKMSEVRFTAAKSGETSLLEITTSGRQSVLELVRRLLFALRIDIVRVESIVREEGILERFELAEQDGGLISPRRAARVRSTIRKALRNGSAPDAAA